MNRDDGPKYIKAGIVVQCSVADSARYSGCTASNNSGVGDGHTEVLEVGSKAHYSPSTEYRMHNIVC